MKIKSILTVLDFSENTGRVLDYTAEFAKVENSSIYLLHSEPPISGYAYVSPGLGYGGFLGFGEYASINQEIESIHLENDLHAMKVLKKQLEAKGLDVEIRLIQGDAAIEIEKAVQELKTDLIIMGSHRRGFFSSLLSDKPEEAVLRHCSCPILLVPEID
ncbi:MAG: universal stress protein [Spirochaetales bacterium]|nr:universal stress protein [Spirochaetales bacterium]